MSGFLEEVALVADIDDLDSDSDRVVLMTLHSAKGLEFPQVYLTGMEDGLFPSYMSITSDDAMEEIEEERRLAYVGITRAMKNLTVTSARQRMVRGQLQYNRVSRFVREIPAKVMEQPDDRQRGRSNSQLFQSQQKTSVFQQATELFHAKPMALQSNAQTDTMFDQTLSADKKAPADLSGIPEDGRIRNALGYDVGDLVHHQKFGEGMVVKIVSGGRDYEVTVQFHQAGIKKMFAAFAKLKKV